MKADETLLILLGSFLVFKFVESVQHCCAPNVEFSLQEETCSDGKNITLSCDNWVILDEFVDLNNRYQIINDSEGNIYLNVFTKQYLVREPNFCLVNLTSTWTNESRSIAIVCGNIMEWYLKTTTVERRTEIKYTYVFLLPNVMSALALFLCAFIYGVLPPLRDIRGKCYFYFTLNTALGHAVFAYALFFRTSTILPNSCTTNLYLIIFLFLSCFSWTTVLSFHTWRQTKSARIIDESATTMTKYICFGYGFPAVLLLFGFIHVHLAGFSNMLAINCRLHHDTITYLYLFIPVLLSLLINLFFFIDCQRLLWDAYDLQQTTAIKRNLRIIKYRCLINTKLIFIMGIPWLTAIILYCGWIFLPNNYWLWLMILIVLLISSEGIFIFLILVVSRKRVLKVVANKWFANLNFFANKWRTMNDSEAEQETENEENLNNEILREYNNAGNENEMSEEDNTVYVENEIRTNLIRGI